jgi:hypothetical protein
MRGTSIQENVSPNAVAQHNFEAGPHGQPSRA